MKYFYLLSFIILFNFDCYCQKVNIGVNGAAGHTVVNVEEAMEASLIDWNRFCYGGNFQVFYPFNFNKALGLEAGFNRLYYWKEYYSYGGYYREGKVSTIFLGPVFEISSKQLLFQSGLNLRSFTNGSGTALSLMFGGGYEIKLSESAFMPIGLRADIIFDSATPVTINFTTGIKFHELNFF